MIWLTREDGLAANVAKLPELLRQLCRRPPARLLFIIETAKLLPGAVLHDEDGANILDQRGRRKAAILAGWGRFLAPNRAADAEG